MVFRSLTVDRTLLDIYTKRIDSGDPEEGTVTNICMSSSLLRKEVGGESIHQNDKA